MDPDELFALKSQFYLGNYKMAITEGMSMNPSSDRLRIDRDVYVYRSYIGLGEYQKVLNEIGDQHSAPTDLLVVKLFAVHLSQPGQEDVVRVTLNDWLSDEMTKENRTLQLLAAMMYLNMGDSKEALRAIRNGNSLEVLALRIQIYLKIQRVDLAKAELETMQQIDDDSTLTQLSTAWINLALGGSRYQEAAYIFQELQDKNGPSSLLLTGQAVANVKMSRFEEAFRLLQRAIKSEGDWENLPLNRDIVVDVVINLMVCAEHLRKLALVRECIDRLKRLVGPRHPFKIHLDAVENFSNQ